MQKPSHYVSRMSVSHFLLLYDSDDFVDAFLVEFRLLDRDVLNEIFGLGIEIHTIKFTR